MYILYICEVQRTYIPILHCPISVHKKQGDKQQTHRQMAHIGPALKTLHALLETILC